MYEKTVGIVLRETKYKDSDRLLTVLTRDFGRRTLRMYGGKHSKSAAACQLFAFSEFTLLEKQGRYRITEATANETFPELREDIELFSLASYFAQVSETVAQEADPMPELLSLLLNALYAIARLGRPQKLVKAAFELRLACIAGFLPDLRGCAICGKVEADRFDITQGVLQCSACGGDGGIRMPVSPSVLAAMRYITGAEAKRLFSFQLSEDALRSLNAITEGYLSMRLERGFYTLDFYKSLFL